MIRAMAEGQRRFTSDPGPTMEKIRTITGIDDKLAQQIIKGVEWYEPQAQLEPRHPLSLAEPANFSRGATQYLKDRVEDPAMLAQLITKRGDIPAFIDNRPLRAAFPR
jgi:hypothetical protein